MGIAQELANNFSGPIIFDYVWWVLREAKERGIKRLYFMARDGYTLLRVAGILCNRFNLDIDCRYLYCSRAALRMPTYFFIGDEALDILLQWGYYVSLKTVLKRVNLNENERWIIYAECGFDKADEDRQLSKREFEYYSKKLRESRIFRQYIVEKSRASYIDAVEYLRQEGLFDQKMVAIVDSGWTGSIQRSMRQLLEFAGYTGKINGFYFGMFKNPKIAADGEYLTWYFDGKSGSRRKVVFCNNLFECLLAAPHGMTKGYIKGSTGYAPDFISLSHHMEMLANEQSNAICNYGERHVGDIIFSKFDCKEIQKNTSRLIKRYMFKPTKQEASYYGQYIFCDDVTESYRTSLSGPEQTKELKQYSIPRRVLKKVVKSSPQERSIDLFWPYGTASYLPILKRWWYRQNIKMWETLRYFIQQKRPHERKQVSIEKAKEIISSHEIVSFDVFDTLLFRTLNKPTDVFLLMEPWIEKRYNITQFSSKRVTAECIARKTTKKNEITLKDIYENLDIDPEIACALMSFEQNTELQVLRADQDIKELINYSIQVGKRVYIISDMYQDEDFLNKVLKKCEIAGYTSLFVSSNENATKAGNSLYKRIACVEKIDDLSKWLHIGDDYYSDFIVPKSLGIDAYLYDNGRKEDSQKPNSVIILAKSLKAKLTDFLQ